MKFSNHFYAMAIAVVAVSWICCKLLMKHWMAIVMYIVYLKYPIDPNRPVVWKEGASSLSDANENKPNVVVILVDDLGFNDITFNGGGYKNGILSTPNIDSIGHNGVSFSNAYAAHATCAPSRAALLTGKYATKSGFEFTPTNKWGPYIFGKCLGKDTLKGIYHESETGPISAEQQALSPDALTIADGVGQSGYHSMHIGKWHLGATDTSHPTACGFNESLNGGKGSLYLPANHPDVQNCVIDHMIDTFLWPSMRYAVRTEHGSPPFEPEGYMTDFEASEAAKAISANKHNPFLLYLAFTSVHSPLQALKSDYDQLAHIPSHCDRVYASMLVALDRAVGTVLSSLEANGLTENTIVIFTSDNGGPNYIGQPNINAPYRGSKATFFEGGLRVPFFVKYPKLIRPGSIIDTTVSHVDIYPTVMAAAGVWNITHEIDGKDLFAVMPTHDSPPTASAEAAAVAAAGEEHTSTPRSTASTTTGRRKTGRPSTPKWTPPRRWWSLTKYSCRT